MLTVSHITKTYRGSRTANDDVSLRVDEGEVVGLLGHNGAGKTTLINQVAGLTVPTSGAIRIGTCDPAKEPDEARRLVSLMPQGHAPLRGVSPQQAITIMGRIRGLDPREGRQRADQLINELDLHEWRKQSGERLSGGIQRLTAFAMAAVAPVKIAMLDEPTNDVDPMRRRLLWSSIRRMAEDGTGVLLVTHNVVEAERSVDRLVIMDRGRVMASGTVEEVRRQGTGDVRLELEGGAPVTPEDLIGRLRPAGPVSHADGVTSIPLAQSQSEEAVTWAQAQCAKGLASAYTLKAASLEDAYLDILSSTDQEGR